jgi:hypothetical protein
MKKSKIYPNFEESEIFRFLFILAMSFFVYDPQEHDPPNPTDLERKRGKTVNGPTPIEGEGTCGFIEYLPESHSEEQESQSNNNQNVKKGSRISKSITGLFFHPHNKYIKVY